MNHDRSVFANSCLKNPIDPVTKMPKTAYERRKQRLGNEQYSIESSSTCSLVVPPANEEAEQVKSFYKSIPDYTDINHLPEDEFYFTLRSLREKKKIVFRDTIEHIDFDNGINYNDSAISKNDDNTILLDVNKNIKCKINYPMRRQLSTEKANGKLLGETNESGNKLARNDTSFKVSSLKPTRKLSLTDINKPVSDTKKSNLVKNSLKINNDRPKRNHSACSISWNDANIETRNDIDEKFDKFFKREKVDLSPSRESLDDDFRTRSMPSSPLRTKRISSPIRRKRITVPKPFKMTERDEDERVVKELRSLQKSYSDDMLHRKCDRIQFRARPVPIESRIPLYDRILEDQAMRRAISKINSEADLRAQMKPFSFTKREEKGQGPCERAVNMLPKSKKRKRFKARPVPKNLFSNYFYDKLKEDNFFRTMNRRIRAEEMLRTSHAPLSQARDRSRLSTPAAHSDLPTDPSPAAASVSSSDRQRSFSPTKERRKKKDKLPKDFITTTPQPFKFNTADRAAKKTEEVARKLYQESKSTETTEGSAFGLPRNEARALSALELRATATGRSNLAALLRAETVRQKFESEAARRYAEHRKKMEIKQRDRFLRTNPAWHLVRNNHEEDIAMRLQTRRDEERMRREEFHHEMELMYGRVQQQPLLFERYYAPRAYADPVDSIQLTPRKSPKKCNRKKSYYSSPNRSRKVSINDSPDLYKEAVNYLNNSNDKLSDFDDELVK